MVNKLVILFLFFGFGVSTALIGREYGTRVAHSEAVKKGFGHWEPSLFGSPEFKWKSDSLHIVMKEREDGLWETVILNGKEEIGTVISGGGNPIKSDWMLGFRVGCLSAGIDPDKINIDVIEKVNKKRPPVKAGPLVEGKDELI